MIILEDTKNIKKEIIYIWLLKNENLAVIPGGTETMSISEVKFTQIWMELGFETITINNNHRHDDDWGRISRPCFANFFLHKKLSEGEDQFNQSDMGISLC